MEGLATRVTWCGWKVNGITSLISKTHTFFVYTLTLYTAAWDLRARDIGLLPVVCFVCKLYRECRALFPRKIRPSEITFQVKRLSIKFDGASKILAFYAQQHLTH